MQAQAQAKDQISTSLPVQSSLNRDETMKLSTAALKSMQRRHSNNDNSVDNDVDAFESSSQISGISGIMVDPNSMLLETTSTITDSVTDRTSSVAGGGAGFTSSSRWRQTLALRGETRARNYKPFASTNTNGNSGHSGHSGGNGSSRYTNYMNSVGGMRLSNNASGGTNNASGGTNSNQAVRNKY